MRKKCKAIFKMNTLIILCVLICIEQFVLSASQEFVPLAFNKVLKEGSPCSVTPGETAKCVASSQCVLPNQEKLKRLCGWKDLSPVVCCPHTEQIEEFIPLTFNKVLREGSECNVSSSDKGECVSSLRCKLPKEEKSRICEWNGATPIVCCPKNMQIEGKLRLPDCSTIQEEKLCSELLFCRNDRQYQQGGYIYNCSTSLTYCELCCAGSAYDLNRSPPSVEVFQEEGTSCDVSSNVRGTCELLINCNLNSTEGVINICGWARDMPLVCCPQLVTDLLAYGEGGDENDFSITSVFELPDCSKNGNPKSCSAVSYCELDQDYQYGANFYSCSTRDDQFTRRQLCCEQKKSGQSNLLPTISSFKEEGSTCVTAYNETGTCETVNKCFVYGNDVFNICGRNADNELTVCCPGFFGFPDCSIKKKEKACQQFLACDVGKQYRFGGNVYACSNGGLTSWSKQMCCIGNGHNTNHSRALGLQSFQGKGSVCNVDSNSNKRGTCERHVDCRLYPTGNAINVCGRGLYSQASICCSEEEKMQCGEQLSTHDWDHTQLYGRTGIYPGEYVLNRTADILLNQNYTLDVTQMNGDEIAELHARKGSKRFLYKKFRPTRVAPAGGVPAAIERAQYMASLGAKVAGGIKWLCDGVVINSQWVMSAAHCFVNRDLIPDFIRLGVYKKEKSFYEPYHNYDGIEDFGISEVQFYPDFINPQRYHDIVLIRLSRPIPQENSDIERICLPWWPENMTEEGQQLTLSGWGATKFLGDKINVLHEVNLTVFHTAVCDASYSTLSDYDTKWPEGMDPERILCVGSQEGGKDACQGDSGGPLVYTDKHGFFTLAGIVSAGYGCGLKEFPGIYIPITAPEYLEWIKKVTN